LPLAGGGRDADDGAAPAEHALEIQRQVRRGLSQWTGLAGIDDNRRVPSDDELRGGPGGRDERRGRHGGDDESGSEHGRMLLERRRGLRTSNFKSSNFELRTAKRDGWLREADMRRLGLIVLLLTSSTWLFAQGTGGPATHGATAPAQRAPTFRSGVALVQIDVTVLDKKRQPVRGLTAADFTVKEDGHERPITAFTAVDLSGDTPAPAATGAPAPLVARAPGATPAPAMTAEAPAAASRERTPGRLVTILLDRSTPPGEPAIAARQIADTIVDQLGRDDRAAVLYTGFGEPREFTADRALLHATIARSDPSGVFSDEAKRILSDLGGQMPTSATNTDPMTSGACYCGLCVPETIAHVAESVQDASERKVLFFVGHDMALQSPGVDCGFLLRKARDRMVRAIDVANLTVHVLDPVGLETVTCAGKADCTGGVGSVLVPGRGRMSAAMGRHLQESARLQTNSEQDATLMTLPGYTGGRAVLNTNTPWAAVPAIFAESAAYYLIAIQPGHPAADGSYHRLEVKVKRRGLQVRAREGYYATE
jgi:VWFA-related protein